MMTEKQQGLALKYAIIHLSNEVQTIDELIKGDISDFMQNVMTHKREELNTDLVELTGAYNALRSAISQRLTKEQWQTVWINVEESKDETDEDIEVVWLDGSDEWVLCAGTELFEDGFISEKEAQERLNHVEQNYIQ